MQDFWNFKDFLVVAEHYWPWLALAGLWGLVLGWYSCTATGHLLPPQYRNEHDV